MVSSAALPALRYLALPAPSGNRAAIAGASVVAPNALDPNVPDPNSPDKHKLPPVPLVPPVGRRRTQPEDGSQGTAATTANQDDPSRIRRRVGKQAGEQGDDQGLDKRPRSGPLAASALPNTGFVVQSLSQETLGAGLHIESWQSALSSYRSAAAIPIIAAPSHSFLI